MKQPLNPELPKVMTREQFLDLHDAVLKLLKRRMQGFLIEPLQAAELEHEIRQYLEFKGYTGESKRTKALRRDL